MRRTRSYRSREGDDWGFEENVMLQGCSGTYTWAIYIPVCRMSICGYTVCPV